MGWAEDWSQSRIDANRTNYRNEKKKYHGGGATTPPLHPLREKRSENRLVENVVAVVMRQKEPGPGENDSGIP